MRTLICPVEIVDDARELAGRVPEGVGLFSRPCGTLDEDGVPVVSHYLAHYTNEAGYLAALLPYKSYDEEDEEGVPTEHEGDVPRLLEELQVTPEEEADALAILAQLDISDQSAEAACARLGIVML